MATLSPIFIVQEGTAIFIISEYWTVIVFVILPYVLATKAFPSLRKRFGHPFPAACISLLCWIFSALTAIELFM